MVVNFDDPDIDIDVIDELTKVVLRYLSENKDIVNTHQFDLLYDRIYKYNRSSYNRAIMSYLFLNSGIDPLQYMTRTRMEMYTDLDIKEIHIPNNIKSMEQASFYNCKQLEKVEIAEGISVIPSGAFRGCEKLKIIKLPSTITRIWNNAFGDCLDIEKIEYNGSKEDWEKITIGVNNPASFQTNVTFLK